MKVGVDTDAMVTKLQDFVTAYNSIITYVGSQSIVDKSLKLKGPFVGETLTARLTSNMKSAVSSTYSASSVITALEAWRALGDTWGVPVLVGEFGLAPAAPGAPDFVRACFEGLDAHRLSGTLWEASTTADDWNEEGMSVTGLGGQERATVLLDRDPEGEPSVLRALHDPGGHGVTL